MSLDRLRNSLGPVTMHVEPGKIVLRDGTVLTRDWYGGPILNPIAYALRLAQEGEVIGVRGTMPGCRIGGTNFQRVGEAPRPNREPLPRVAIVADDDVPIQPVLGDFLIAGTSVKGLDGVDHLTFCGVELQNRKNAKATILVEMDSRQGTIRVWGCKSTSEDPTKWSGYGRMWFLRFHGFVNKIDVQENEVDDALEHSIVYADNIGYHSHPIHRIMNNVVSGRGGGRTNIQICNRANEGESGGGPIRIEGNRLRSIGGGGGGAITIAGHLGSVHMRANEIELDGTHGGVVVWSDAGHGLHLDEDGFTTGRVHIEGLKVRGGENPHVAISGAREVHFTPGFRLIAGNSTERCIDLVNNYGGGRANGPVRFLNFDGPMSQYSGFQSGSRIVNRNKVLSDAEMDALQV